MSPSSRSSSVCATTASWRPTEAEDRFVVFDRVDEFAWCRLADPAVPIRSTTTATTSQPRVGVIWDPSGTVRPWSAAPTRSPMDQPVTNVVTPTVVQSTVGRPADVSPATSASTTPPRRRRPPGSLRHRSTLISTAAGCRRGTSTSSASSVRRLGRHGRLLRLARRPPSDCPQRQPVR